MTDGERLPRLAAIAVGALAMMVTGLQPLLLGALVEAGRLTQAVAHRATLIELLAMGITVAVLGSRIPPTRLRRIGAAAAVAYALANLAGAVVEGDAIVGLRALAGGAAGVLIWITIGMLARLERPEPWAAGFFVSQAVGQLVVAALAAALVLPAFGSVGGDVFAAAVAALAIPAALMLAPAYEPPEGRGLPPARGLLGLLAVLLYVTAAAGVWFHMRDGAPSAVFASMAVVAVLAGQLAGAAVAVSLAGRIRFVWVFAGVCALTLAAWTVLAMRPPGYGFLTAIAVSGFAGMVLGTWLFSFLNGVDPSRRAAAISASVQLVGSALGPVLGASLAVSVGCVVVSLLLVLWLQRMALVAARP